MMADLMQKCIKQYNDIVSIKIQNISTIYHLSSLQVYRCFINYNTDIVVYIIYTDHKN